MSKAIASALPIEPTPSGTENPPPIYVYDDTLTKADADALGKCFAAEINAAMSDGKIPPFHQSKSKRFQALADRGLVELLTYDDTFAGMPCHFEGWVLTLRGHATYCAWAAEQPDLGEEE